MERKWRESKERERRKYGGKSEGIVGRESRANAEKEVGEARKNEWRDSERKKGKVKEIRGSDRK